MGWNAEFDPSWIVFKSISIIGVAHYSSLDLKNALDFVADNLQELPFDRVLSHHFPLTDINEAFAQQDAGHVTRSALVPHP